MKYIKNIFITTWIKRIPTEKRKYFWLGVMSLILILIPSAIYVYQQTHKVEAAWWNDSWGYRQTVSITSGTALIDYQVTITLDTATLITAGKMRSDCNDIRVTDVNGNILPHWIEGGAPGCNDAATEIWVKVSSIPTSGQTLFIYYGNSSAVNAENPNKVFLLFDDFKNVDTSKWTDTTGTNTIVSSGYDNQALNTINDANDIRYYSRAIFSGGYSVKARMREDGADGGLFFDALNDANGYLVTSRRGGGVNAFQWYKRAAGAWSNISLISTVSSWTSTEFRTLEVTRIGTNISVKDNETAITYDLSTDASYSSGGVGIRGSSEQTIDWIFVKKAITTEPTVNSPTNEEKSQGPVAYWKFDEGYGTVANDSTSNKNNGNISSPAWTTGIKEKALGNGSGTTTVTVADNPTIDISEDLTISFWYIPRSYHTNYSNNIIVKQTNTSDSNFNFYEFGDYLGNGDQGKYRWYANAGGVWKGISGQWTVPELNKWYFITLTYNSSSGGVMYVNGVQIGNPAGSGSLATNNQPLIIRASSTSKASIDDVKIYNYVRSATQIKLEYASRGSIKGTASSIGNDLVRQGSLANGLVGYWKQDEATWSGTLSEVVDSSGNGNHGTAAGTTGGKAYPATGKFGNGGYFDGVDDWIDSITQPSINITPNIFTIAGWINPDNQTGFFITPNSNGIDQWVQYEPNNQRLALTVAESADTNQRTRYSTSNSVPLNTWTHFAISINDKNIKIYINGVLNSEYDETINIGDWTGNWRIGQRGNNSYYYKGYLDEIRVYNRVLSPTEVSKLYNYAPGPVGYYDFEEGQGSNLYDKSGNENNSTSFLGSPRWTSGKYGGSLKFNGSSSYIRTPSINLGSNFTIGFWMKPTNLHDYGDPLSAGTSDKHITFVTYADGHMYYNVGDGTSWGNYITTPVNTFKNNQWYYISGTSDNGTTKLFVNGTQVGTASNSYNINEVFNIGSRTSNGYWFEGNVDEVRIYNYARTAGQIVEDMNAGHPTGGSPIASQIGYYKFDEGYGATAKNSGNQGSTIDTTISGAIWNQNGKFGKALQFDANDDNVYKTDNDALDLRTGSYTASAWVQVSSATTPHDIIIQKGGSSAGTAGYWFGISTVGKLEFYVSDGTSYLVNGLTGNTSIADNKWHYVGFTWDPTVGVKLYLDGNLDKQASATTSVDINTGQYFRIGGYGSAGYTLNGLIDEVKIYNTALTAEQIKLDYNQGKSLVLGASGTDADGKTASNSASRAYCIPGDTSTCNPPIAEWNFEEKQGNTANDTSGNGNTGTIYEALWKDGKVDSSLSFNGTTSDYVIKNPAVNFPTSTVTVQFWMKSSDTSKSGTPFSYSATGNNEFLIYDYNNFSIYANDLSASTGVSANDGKWHLITTTWQSSDGAVKMYKDGISVYSGTLSSGSPISAGGAIVLAQEQDALGGGFQDNQAFLGQLDQVKVYDYVRTPAQIAWDYNQGKPVGWWKLDECQGITAGDSSGNGNTGTITIGGSGTQTSAGTCQTSGTAWYNGATGKFNSSLNFDGTDDYVLTNPIVFSGDMTISAWFNPTTFPSAWAGVGTFLYNSGSSGTGWQITPLPSSIKLVVGRTGMNYTTQTFTATIPTGTWSHILTTYNGGVFKVYLNGRQVGSDWNQTAVYTASGNRIHIGRWSSDYNGYYFNGQIDDVRIYNYALTPLQVKQVMNQGAGVRWGP